MATFVPQRRSKRARLDLGALRATKTAAALAQLRVSGPCCGSLRRKDPMGLAVRWKPAAQGSSGGSPARRKPARRAAARPQHGGEGGGSRLVSPSKSRKQVSAHLAVGAAGSGCCDRTVSMFIVSMIVSLKRFAVYRPHARITVGIRTNSQSQSSFIVGPEEATTRGRRCRVGCGVPFAAGLPQLSKTPSSDACRSGGSNVVHCARTCDHRPV